MAAYTLVQTNMVITGSKFRISRSDGQYWEMPPDAALTEEGMSRRIKVEERLRRDGGTVVGDETFEPRPYTLKYNLSAEDQEDYFDSMNQIEAFFRPDKRPYILTDTSRGIRAEFILPKHKVSHPVGNRGKSSENTLSIQLKDSLWESVDEFAHPGGAGSQTGGATTGGTGTGVGAGVGVLMQDGDEISVNNPGRFDCFPEFYIIPQDNVVSFTLRNTTADGAFTFDSNALVSGVLLRISAVTGIIQINGVDRSSGLTAGGIWRLIPGSNTVRYESVGGDIRIELVWRLRYAY